MFIFINFVILNIYNASLHTKKALSQPTRPIVRRVLYVNYQTAFKSKLFMLDRCYKQGPP